MYDFRSTKALFILFLFFLSSFLPILPGAAEQDVSQQYDAPLGTIIGDINDFDPATGSQYLFIHEEQPVVSATQFFRQAWIDAGRPGVEDMVIGEQTSGRASARACSQHVVGDTLNVNTAGGQISAYVAKTTQSVAFIVESGRTLSSTVLNNLASTWDNTIYPTMTTYYGKDYQDGRGLAPPDVDNNCQIQIIIYAIDGAYNTGGYFAPSFASSREAIFVDFADITLSWGKSILAHELEHLLHNALDPYENLWIDEGNADVAIYLCFGVDSTLVSHVNQWTASPELSVRWWNQRFADYGAGYLFTMYLQDHLGGGPAVRQLVQDTATGGAGVRNLLLSPLAGQVGLLGRNMGEAFANFSIAVTLDSDQGIYGFPNLNLNPVCSSGAFCRAQPTEINSDWSTPWSSTGNSVEGWGIRSFKFTPGSASPAPLTIRATADVSNFDGVVVSKATTDGLWSVTDLNFNNNVATALIPGFGNLTDEVWVITWYASTVADCDYTSCGPSYPQGTIDVEAARITSPATLNINTTVVSDRDGDGTGDTMEIGYDVLSNAFFEDLDVQFNVRDGNGSIVDTLSRRVQAGGGTPVSHLVYFTAPKVDQYRIEFSMSDVIGTQVDTATTAPTSLGNMAPTANGSVSQNDVQTWENIQFIGAGFDAWGLSNENNTLPYRDQPVAYYWNFGDNQSSNLKSPLRSYIDVGQYNATLRIQDQGGTWSNVDVEQVNVTDDTDPLPIVTVNNVVIDDSISLMTNQRILFSAGRTVDNVPIDNLYFEWDWGDGTVDSGVGSYLQQHEWGDIQGENQTFTLSLTVSDGINVGLKEIEVTINNRLPIQIFSEQLTTSTYIPLQMPNVFVDDDGQIVSYLWNFEDGVYIGSKAPDRTDDFIMTTSIDENPFISWDTPGLKSVTLQVTDDDNSQVTAQLYVNVLNQQPIAQFSVRTSSTSGSVPIDFRSEDATIDTPYTFDGRSSSDPDGLVGDSSDISFNWTFSDGTTNDRPQVTHSFSTPGIHTVTLIVTDADGEESFPRIVTLHVENPRPIIAVKILDAWIDGEQVTSTTSFSNTTQIDYFTHTFDDENRIYTSPGNMLYFDSYGTRDADRMYEGKFSPYPTDSDEWNGVVEYTWDFGDATPVQHSPFPFHAYLLPGIYDVSLTVRDSFGTGDVSRETFTIIVAFPPTIESIFFPDDIYVDTANAVFAKILNENGDLYLSEIYRDTNIEDGSIVDRDERISQEFEILWDFNTEVDDNANGNPMDDWVSPLAGSVSRASTSWSEPGKYTVLVQVCDGFGTCSTLTTEIEVTIEPSNRPSLSEFSADEWKSWAVDAGSEFAKFLGLIIVALVLGYLWLREPSELEEEAKEAAETYNDLERVETQGGMLGMDHHKPPPAPKILSKEERRNSDSGYVRPLRRR
jgi:PKD repeat protein